MHLFKKTNYSSKITEIENKIPNVGGFVKKPDYNAKANQIESKIVDHNHDKYITTPEFNKLTENFKSRLKQADLVTKTDFDIKLQGISKRVTSNKTKHFLEKLLKN